MRLLIDTHVFLWTAADPEKLGKAVRTVLEDRANEVFVSAAVAWEIAIKYPRDLALPAPPASYVPARTASLGFKSLPISQAHALAVSGLPEYHRDPFDRIMIAQAQVEGLTLVTADAECLKYPVNLLAAR